MPEQLTPVWVQFAVPALTAACGVLGGMVVSGRQTAAKAREAFRRKQTSVCLKYLDPLRLAAENLVWRLHNIEQKIEENQPGEGGLDWMLRTFHWAKEPQEIHHRAPSPREFALWCNSEGYFAVSTIYATAVYLLHARRTRREYLDDRELVERLDAVRLAFGHYRGLYMLLQDSMGDFVHAEDGREIGYRAFCTKLSQEEERASLLNVLDYYRDINKKLEEQRQGISKALVELLLHLQNSTGMSVHLPSQLTVAAPTMQTRDASTRIPVHPAQAGPTPSGFLPAQE